MEYFKSTDNKREENNGTRSKYRKLSDSEKLHIDALKEIGDGLIDVLETLRASKPEAAREFSLAITHIEDAVMRSVRGITQ